MVQFSKPALQKLNNHLAKLQISVNNNNQGYHTVIKRRLKQKKVFIKNKTLTKSILINLMFLNIELINIKQIQSNMLKDLLLNNKSIFINYDCYNKGYLKDKNFFSSGSGLTNNKQENDDFVNNVNYLIKKNFKISIRKIIKNSTFTKLNQTNINKKLKILSATIKNNIIGKWYLFFSRFLVLSTLHFIPFVQLTTSLFYTQANKLVVHPILCHLYNFIPFLIQFMNLTMPIVNQDTFSFLLIGFYFQVFIVHFKSYRIPRKIAFQGTFALSLMLLNYCSILNKEILVILYKFIKRFFFINNQNLDLIRDDLTFYIEDLEDLRDYKERFLQLGESVFSLDDITKVTKIYEANTLIPLLGVIALLYNCVYFILRGQKPIIPVVTKTVQRMMIDRNGTEPS